MECLVEWIWALEDNAVVAFMLLAAVLLTAGAALHLVPR